MLRGSIVARLWPCIGGWHTSTIGMPGQDRHQMYEHHELGVRDSPAGADKRKSIYAGITTSFSERHGSTIAVAIRDATYLLDFIEKKYHSNEHQPRADEAVEFIISQLKAYGEKHLEKIVGVAMHRHVAAACPNLCSRLWAELDIIPLVLPGLSLLGRFASRAQAQLRSWESKTIDEQAESMARKCVRLVETGRCVGNYKAETITFLQTVWTRELSSAASRLYGPCGG